MACNIKISKKMKEWLQKPLVAGLIGAIIGSFVTAKLSLMQFEKEQRISRYVNIVDEINKIVILNEKLHRLKQNKSDVIETEDLINLSLNRAFNMAMVFLPDEVFIKVADLLNGDFDKHTKNEIYYLFRKSLFPHTKISYDEVKNKFLKIQ